MGAKVKVENSQLKTMASEAKRQGEELDAILKEYIAIMTDAKVKGLKSGSAGQNLGRFVRSASLLQGKLDVIGNEVDSEVSRFLDTVDSIDQFSL